MNFYLDKEEQTKLEEWIKTRKYVPCGAIGGRYTFSFTPTSLGQIIKVKDSITGEELNLTDSDSW